MKGFIRFCLLIFIILIMRAVAFSAVSEDSSIVLKEIMVRSGDNLWNIAEEYAPRGSNYQVFISRLEEINDIESALIYPGEKLLVPVNKNK